MPNIVATLPKDYEELEKRIKAHKLPGGIHILLGRKRFRYTQDGAKRAFAEAGRSAVLRVRYMKSTYDPTLTGLEACVGYGKRAVEIVLPNITR